MPSHVHLVVCPRGEAKVSALLAGVKLAVTKRAVRHVRQHAPAFLERMSDISGDGSVTHRFWQRGGGYDRNLWTTNAVWKMIDYIHMNPVEDGLVTRPEDWVWSSAAWYRDKRPSQIPLNIDRVPMRRSR